MLKRANRFAMHPCWRLLILDMEMDPVDFLSHAQLPADLHAAKDAWLSPAEYFRLWLGLEASSNGRNVAVCSANRSPWRLSIHRFTRASAVRTSMSRCSDLPDTSGLLVGSRRDISRSAGNCRTVSHRCRPDLTKPMLLPAVIPELLFGTLSSTRSELAQGEQIARAPRKASDIAHNSARVVVHRWHAAKYDEVTRQSDMCPIASKHGRPVDFHITADVRSSLLSWLERRGGSVDNHAFPNRTDHRSHLSTCQYTRVVDEWITAIGLRREDSSTHSLRRTKALNIYKATGNLRAIQILLGHTKIENTVRSLGVDIEDALELAERTGIWAISSRIRGVRFWGSSARSGQSPVGPLAEIPTKLDACFAALIGLLVFERLTGRRFGSAQSAISFLFPCAQ